MKFTVNDLFCGAGGMGLGFQQAGYQIVGAWDFDKYAVMSYKENVGDHVKQSDIREMTWKDMPKANVWTFGFPCQDLSIAGKQEGIKVECQTCNHVFNIKKAEDRACPECKSADFKPVTRSGLFFEVMRLIDETRENAPDQLPEVIMAENVKPLKNYLDILEQEYSVRGYKMFYQLYNSKYWEVPQSRERYYVVGIREDLGKDFVHPTEQTEFIPKLSSVLQGEVPDKYYMSDEKSQAIIDQALLKLKELGTVHAALTPHRVDKRQNGPRARPEEEPMFTITAQDLHGVIERVDGTQSFYIDKDGCAYCCDANYHKGTSPGDLGSGRRTQVIELWKQEGKPQLEVIGMLDIKGKDQWKRVYSPDGLSPTLTAVQGGLQEVKTFDYVKYRVRKLTPREYARLQGFPETYKFVCSDSQMYKQFGNAVTVNVARAIASALLESIFISREEVLEVKDPREDKHVRD